MSRPGWIKLFNQTLDSDFWQIDQSFSFRDAFIHVLLSANWRSGVTNKNGHTLQIQRGQWLTSIRKLCDLFHWDKHKVYQWLKFMTDSGMITHESVGFGTLLTVVKYDFYQGDTDTVTHTVTHTPTHEDTHAVTHEVTQRSKTIDIRQQTKDSIFAPSEPPPKDAENGSDQEDDNDEEWITPEEAGKIWESMSSTRKMRGE